MQNPALVAEVITQGIVHAINPHVNVTDV